MKPTDALILNIRRPPWPGWLLPLPHLLPAALALALALPAWFQLLCCLFAPPAIFYHWRRQSGGGHACAIAELSWRARGDWLLRRGDGREAGAVLLGSSFVSPWLVVLHLRLADGRCCRLALTERSLGVDGLRRLRVRLRDGTLVAEALRQPLPDP
ncbi:MAG: hypothetical protein B0D96_01980 [Candidatus Sedimenticola endophacoides]|uniref:Toxin CptA n=1 Tax=Candidatus Sedimenticola endophacoides TaxID=2548426 RepID=A0A6N4DT61_9GAMM|nr:MAG: hypothetical protein B0D94_08020 [Candidatus Sedimenticola endophacoides]OQX37528.1 MAG: hypothetical protein B0D96_01980 [Candidatus Sedimenticola endophacoides]OQX40235.1 MAG: hypothetical protein B0D89_08585 [Candidatus Sedimenticola endophacoides]PUD98519.1 MAG: hypothetical protein C3L26_12255 [Candidatus Sedimenticola endophacoides]PUE00165.1 MAG: hypothetical protein C3L24_09655 [Candidatus Sedimenticola endophacoides]